MPYRPKLYHDVLSTMYLNMILKAFDSPLSLTFPDKFQRAKVAGGLYQCWNTIEARQAAGISVTPEEQKALAIKPQMMICKNPAARAATEGWNLWVGLRSAHPAVQTMHEQLLSIGVDVLGMAENDIRQGVAKLNQPADDSFVRTLSSHNIRTKPRYNLNEGAEDE